MAKLLRAVVAPDLGQMSIRELSGLVEWVISDFRAVGLGFIQDVMDAMDANGGDLTKVSTPVIGVSQKASDLMGDAVLRCKAVPADWKAKYVPSAKPKATVKKVQNRPHNPPLFQTPRPDSSGKGKEKKPGILDRKLW